MANFPIATWGVIAPAFEIRRVGGGGGTSTVAESTSLFYGFGLTSSGLKIPASDTLFGRVLTALAATGYVTGTSGVYDFKNNTNPDTSPLDATITITGFSAVGTSSVVLDFYNLTDAAVYGCSTTTLLLTPLQLTRNLIFNPAGVWVPCGVTGDVRRTTMQRAAASSSDMSGLNTNVVNWGQIANVEMMSSIFPAGNLTRWFASTPIYASAAGRNVNDPNNTLEGLLAAAATGVTFRVYREPASLVGTTPGTYQECRMPDIANKSSASDYSNADDEPRLWSTNGLIFRAE